MAKYKVVGNHKVAGVAPGGWVELPEGPQTAALVRAGHVKPVKPLKEHER